MRKIVYNKWNKMGRMANQMFELAALYGMGEKYDRKPVLPASWNYQQWFKERVEVEHFNKLPKEIAEPSYEFSGWEYWNGANSKAGDILNICGWLQSSGYFNKEIARKLFEFKDDFKERVREKWKHVFEKPVIMIGIRVAKDYVENGNYKILPILYQISALYKHFPDWRENYNILVCADDMQYAKLNMDCHKNIFFADGCIDVEQMYLGTLCQHFILANSTFSWWQAYLGEKEGSVIVRPSEYFKGYLATICSTETFWEEGWVEHDWKGEKLNMDDVTFTIPVKYDHPDRAANLNLVIKWMHTNFKYEGIMIIVGEEGGVEFRDGSYAWIGFSEGVFHRTKMLNYMAKHKWCNDIVVNFDADNVCPILQMMIGVDMIRRGEADGVYPYDGRVARVPRHDYIDVLTDTAGDCGVFGGKIFKGTRAIDPLSVGHIIIWNKQKFLEGGEENENFISYGPEDVERKERFEKLGYRIERVKGIVYHIDHYCGPDSSGMNPKFGRNYDELIRIRSMNKEELREEVDGWTWNKKEKALI